MADQTVPMISPDGKDVADVPADQVEHFKSLGAKVVEAPPPPSLGRRLAKGALDALPGIGGVVGGVISTPETGGAATIPGIALGAGVGRGVRDVIGHLTGLDDPTTPLEKAAHIVGDTAMTGATAAVLPGVVAAAKAPMQTLREGAEQFGNAMPASVRKLMDLFPSLPKAAGPLLERPAWQTWGEPPAPIPNALSASDKLLLSKQGYSPELIQRIEQEALARAAKPSVAPSRPPISVAPSSPMQPPPARIVPETGETEAAWRARIAARIQDQNAALQQPENAAPKPQGPIGRLTGTKAPTVTDAIQQALNELRGQLSPVAAPSRPPISVSPSSPMQPPAPSSPAAAPSDLLQQLKDSLAARTASAAPSPITPIQSVEGRPIPLYGSAGHAKGVTSNALEAASNRALAEGHYDEAERLIARSLQAFSSGGPMLGVLAAAIAHKARQIVEPLRADPAFQSAAPAKQQQMIQQALRQPGARGSLTSLLGS